MIIQPGSGSCEISGSSKDWIIATTFSCISAEPEVSNDPIKIVGTSIKTLWSIVSDRKADLIVG